MQNKPKRNNKRPDVCRKWKTNMITATNNNRVLPFDKHIPMLRAYSYFLTQNPPPFLLT